MIYLTQAELKQRMPEVNLRDPRAVAAACRRLGLDFHYRKNAMKQIFDIQVHSPKQ